MFVNGLVGTTSLQNAHRDMLCYVCMYACMSVCMYVCMFIHMYNICMYVDNIYMCVCVYVYMYIYVCVIIYVYVCEFIHIYVYDYICNYIMYRCVRVCVCLRYFNAYIGTMHVFNCMVFNLVKRSYGMPWLACSTSDCLS